MRVGAPQERTVNADLRKQVIPVIAFWLHCAFPLSLTNMEFFSWIMLKQILPFSKVISLL